MEPMTLDEFVDAVDEEPILDAQDTGPGLGFSAR